MAPRGNLLLPSPAAFRSRNRGPQLTISGCVFLAGRAKRWEAQVRFASPISAVLGITDAARPRGGGSGARDSVPAAGPRLGVRGQQEFECSRGRKAVPHRPHPRCSVPVGWGRGRPDGCPDMARRHRVKAGPRGSAGEARWAAPRQRSGPRPAPRRPPRFAFAPRPLGDAQAASVEEARVPDGLEAERRAGKVRGPTRLSQQAGPSALRVHTSLVKPGPLPAATATPLPVAAAAGTTVPRPRRSEGASLGGGARRCLVQRPRAARKTCGRHVGTQPRAVGRAGRRPWKGRGHCPWLGPLVCAADAHTGRAPVPTGREALAAPPPSSALCGLPAVGFSWMWAR